MRKPVEDILFDYLRDILYSPETASLELSELPVEFQKFGEGLNYLLTCVLENKIFMTAISKGNLSVAPPSVHNPIASPAKALQGSLRHITWQTNQVAKGDYKQRIDFMGEFSASFNIMIEQLAERRLKLEQEKITINEKNKELSRFQELLLTIAAKIPDLIVLFDLDNHSELILNRPVEVLKEKYPSVSKAIFAALWDNSQPDCIEKNQWDFSFALPDNTDADMPQNLYYLIDSYPMIWNDHKAMLHIIRDRTLEAEKELQLKQDAYNDPLTGLYNRRYAMKLLNQWHGQNIPFCISMIDVDHLKYCNDAFGHEKGDSYIIHVSRTLSQIPGKTALCRIGGDEFLVISKDNLKEQQDKYLEDLRSQLINDSNNGQFLFTQSFSFGTSSNLPVGQRTLSEILKESDMKMYQYKSEFKPKIVKII